jgi:phage terminase Nu1 subunit (DNA packaging protein)
MAEARWQVGTLREVAEFFGVALQTVKQWHAGEKPCPGTRGAYPLDGIARWRLSRQEGHDAETAAEKQRLENEKLRAQIDRLRALLARDQDRLIERETVQQSAAALFRRQALRLQRLPDELAAELPEAARAELLPRIRERVRHCLQELAELPDAAPKRRRPRAE